VGTVGYMAPEQVQGRRADQRSDVFALGAVLYEMLSGRRAFQRESAVETMAAILKEEPRPLAAVQPALPPSLDRLVKRCLEKRAEDRVPSARDVAFALDAIRSAGGTAARPRSVRLASARAWAAIAVLLALGIAALWILGRRPTPRIAGSAQVTFTGAVAAPFKFGGLPQSLLTDGARIYFQQLSEMAGAPEHGSGLGVASVSTAGGEVVTLTTPFRNVVPLALSPDGHRILLRDAEYFQQQGTLWVM